MKPIPAAAVAFIRDSGSGIEVYLNRRPAHFRYYPGAYVFPGGRADEEDENPRDTARREVMEEIAVEIDPSRLVLLRNIHTSSHAGPVYHMRTFVYVVAEEFQTRINRAEVDDELWISVSEALTGLDLPYQIRAAVFTMSRFTRSEDLLRTLAHGSIDEDFWF